MFTSCSCVAKERYQAPEAAFAESLRQTCICDSLIGDDNESVTDETWEI